MRNTFEENVQTHAHNYLLEKGMFIHAIKLKFISTEISYRKPLLQSKHKQWKNSVAFIGKREKTIS